MRNPTVVNKYVNDLGKILNDLYLTEKPKQIWSMDETGKQSEHNSVRVAKSQRTYQEELQPRELTQF